MAGLLRLFLALLLAALLGPAAAREIRAIAYQDLPPEARQTLRLIDEDGPFPYRRDGIVFGNRERRLPAAPRDYYREYTVPTPGSRDRGARRIVAGGDGERYYSPDHYRHFLSIRP
ncbi:ribonuclease [Denitratisoma sp. DHT3]|uniref:ribonuclease domain-containing protein n=1 Tax=Denitratisoma sp. DHT3 TaxID=1981880 RepID=UPI0011988EB5|nr:ribonuclease domain-containing protein [Denitratisoma sp. DHT3]QDX82233.1 ribonuclease [Denitratisoma sp. DHT3]